MYISSVDTYENDRQSPPSSLSPLPTASVNDPSWPLNIRQCRILESQRKVGGKWRERNGSMNADCNEVGTILLRLYIKEKEFKVPKTSLNDPSWPSNIRQCRILESQRKVGGKWRERDGFYRRRISQHCSYEFYFFTCMASCLCIGLYWLSCYL
jgi:hypothetical protein